MLCRAVESVHLHHEHSSASAVSELWITEKISLNPCPLFQCARRWFDEGDTSHLVNLGKYVSAMLAAGAKVAYEKDEGLASLSLLVAVSSTATVYQLYWDFVKDWGLLQPNSKNPWLRNDLILKRKSVYYLSMVRSSVHLQRNL
jgi:hypothetical protein